MWGFMNSHMHRIYKSRGNIMSWILSGIIVQPQTGTKWIHYRAFWPHLKSLQTWANLSFGKRGDFSFKRQRTLTSFSVTLESESKLNSLLLSPEWQDNLKRTRLKACKPSGHFPRYMYKYPCMPGPCREQR